MAIVQLLFFFFPWFASVAIKCPDPFCAPLFLSGILGWLAFKCRCKCYQYGAGVCSLGLLRYLVDAYSVLDWLKFSLFDILFQDALSHEGIKFHMLKVLGARKSRRFLLKWCCLSEMLHSQIEQLQDQGHIQVLN